MVSFADAIKALDQRLRNGSSAKRGTENTRPSHSGSTKRSCNPESTVSEVKHKRQKLETVTNYPPHPSIRDNAPTGLPHASLISSGSQPQASQLKCPSSLDISPSPEPSLSAVSPQLLPEMDACSDNHGHEELDCEDDLQEDDLGYDDLFNDELDIEDYFDDSSFLSSGDQVQNSLWDEEDLSDGEPNEVASNLLSGDVTVRVEGENNKSMTEHAPSSSTLPYDESGVTMERPPSDNLETPTIPGVWLGVSCNCHSHPCDASLSLSSPLHVDDTCKILTHFNLSFHRFWRYIICNDKGAFIPLGRLSIHLFSPNSSKKSNAGRTNNKLFNNVIDHISAAFRIPKDQGAISPPFLEFRVAGIQPPIRGRQCPYCAYCGQWQNGYVAHCVAALNRERSSTEPGERITCHYTPKDAEWRPWPELDQVWMQALFCGGVRQKDKVFIPILNYENSQTLGPAPTPFEENVTLNASPYVVPEGSKAYPKFVKALGWDTWLEMYLAGGTVDSLMSLIAIPRKRTLSPPSSPASPLWLEFVVTMRLRPFLERYLKEANDWLDLESNSMMRDALSKGLKTPFQRFEKDKSYERYARTPLHSILMLLRCKDKPDDNLIIPQSELQQQTVDALHRFVFSTPPDAEGYDATLEALTHELMVSLIAVELGWTSLPGCPTDVVLLILIFGSQGSIRKASQVTGECAKHLYWTRCCCTHMVRLAGMNSSRYVPFLRAQTSRPKSISRNHELEAALLSASRWCVPDPQLPTPLTHSQLVWRKAAIDVKAERSLVIMSWSPDGLSFEYSRPGLPKFRIHMSLFKDICWSIEASLTSRFLALFPDGFDASNLPWDEISDNPSSSQSFLDCDEVYGWLKDAQIRLKTAYYLEGEPRHRLTASGQLQRPAVMRLLELDQQFQGSLAAEFVGATGISLRAITASLLNYRGDGRNQRNVYIIQDTVALAGGKEKAELRRGGRRGIVNFMSPKGGEILIRYLALIRQVIIEILQDAGLLETSVYFKTRIFAKYTTKEMEWQSRDITQNWCSHTRDLVGSDTTIVDMRQIGHGIYGKLFPTVRNSNSLRQGASAVDGQGDHGRRAALDNYGRDNIFCFGNSGIETTEFMLVSGICHAIGHLRGLDDNWPKEVLESPLFYDRVRAEQGLDLARYLVATRYVQHCSSITEIRQIMQSLLCNLPFILTAQHPPQIHFQDEILLQVTSMLAWGEGGAPSSSPSISVDTVVDAILLIVQAIDEWSDGSAVRPINRNSSHVEKRYKRLKEEASQRLKREAANPDNWGTLIKNLAALQPDGIPPLLPSELFPIGNILGPAPAL